MVASIFQVVQEEFLGELNAIRKLVTAFEDQGQVPKVRITAANSATLLLAATFEEFVRQMAREYARTVVNRTPSFDKLPKKLASTAWKRSMESLARVRFDAKQPTHENLITETQVRFSVIYEFVKGDLKQDIYRDLIYNEHNMRPEQLNSMFSVAGLSNVCLAVSEKQPLLTFFGQTEAAKTHAKFLAAMEEFFEHRNEIAHALNPSQSSSTQQIKTDIDMLEAFSKALFQTLEES